MNYIDLEGNKIETSTSQDSLLRTLYTHVWGRILLKPLVYPMVSSFIGRLLSMSLSTHLVPKFIESNKINMEPYVTRSYKSFNDFFCREINTDNRPFSQDEGDLLSPCDSRLSVYPITSSSRFMVKDTPYTVKSLLHSDRLAKRFEGGYLYLFRLCVDDYHRYSYCASGIKSNNYRIAGKLHTVNPIANDYVPIYKENSREYTVLHTKPFGDIVQMEVGALLVGKIKNHHGKCYINRGEEKGFFEYGGSTIILLVEQGKVNVPKQFLDHTEQGYETIVRMGQTVGTSACES